MLPNSSRPWRLGAAGRQQMVDADPAGYLTKGGPNKKMATAQTPHSTSLPSACRHPRPSRVPADDSPGRARRSEPAGGKDSQTMTILLTRIVPHDQFLAVHAPFGEVEWPGTIEHIENTLPDGVPLILAPVTSGKSLLDSIEARGRFPSASIR